VKKSACLLDEGKLGFSFELELKGHVRRPKRQEDATRFASPDRAAARAERRDEVSTFRTLLSFQRPTPS
jgi:hypothetical protein